jgi:hypothetical protein
VVNGHVVRPFVASAGVTPRGCSTILERRYTDFGADEPFAKVPAKLKEHYGIDLPLHLARTITEKHAHRMRAGMILANELPDQGAAVVIGETDGSMLPIVTIAPRQSSEEPADGRKRRRLGWKEARLSLAHAQGSVTPIFNATMGGPDTAGDQLRDCVIRAGASSRSTIHCVGDGATWIADQVDRVFADHGSYLIDVMHLSDYLAAAAPRCCPGMSAPWLEQQKELMLTDRMAEVLNNLASHREPAEIPDQEAPVRSCYRYLINRPRQFGYQEAIAADLPIGSGEIESAHRYIIQNRLKIAGAWWSLTNANAMLALRTLRANGGWDGYWEQYVKHAA